MLVWFIPKKEKNMRQLIVFYGRECPHCKKMIPLIDRAIKEEGIKIKKLEIWHDKKNADLMRSYKDTIKAACEGQLRVPTFLNETTKDITCGEMEYTDLVKWLKK